MGANFNFDHLCLCRLEGKTVVAPEAPEDEAMEEEEDGNSYFSYRIINGFPRI